MRAGLSQLADLTIPAIISIVSSINQWSLPSNNASKETRYATFTQAAMTTHLPQPRPLSAPTLRESSSLLAQSLLPPSSSLSPLPNGAPFKRASGKTCMLAPDASSVGSARPETVRGAHVLARPRENLARGESVTLGLSVDRR